MAESGGALCIHYFSVDLIVDVKGLIDCWWGEEVDCLIVRGVDWLIDSCPLTIYLTTIVNSAVFSNSFCESFVSKRNPFQRFSDTEICSY